MSPKKSLIIIASLSFIIIAAAFGAYLLKRSQQKADLTNGQGTNANQAANGPVADISGIIEKKNNSQPLSDEESAALQNAIYEKAEEIVNGIEKAAEDRSYAQDEVDIILNPQKAAETVLGIKDSPATAQPNKRITPEEIDKILNPNK